MLLFHARELGLERADFGHVQLAHERDGRDPVQLVDNQSEVAHARNPIIAREPRSGPFAAGRRAGFRGSGGGKTQPMDYVEHTHIERRRVPARVPKDLEGPALLIFLLGLWVSFVPLVGPYFGFGVHTDDAWSFSAAHWILSLGPGLAAALAGLLMVVPNRAASSFWAFVAAAAGVWLVVGPTLYPLWSSADVQPIAASGTTDALLWIGYFYGPGALMLYLACLAHGVLARPARPEEPVVVAEPIEEPEEQRTVIVG